MTAPDLTDDPQLVGGYHLIASRSRITFTARSIWGLLPVRGHFAEVTGTGELSADGRVSGALRIEVASLRTGMGRRDEHLRSADFFDAQRFRHIDVAVTGLRREAPQRNAMHLSLRVKDVVNDLSVPVDVSVSPPDTVQISTAVTIDRTRFGVPYNRFGFVVNEVDLTADLSFRRTPR
ncbi:YceI family protein [Mycolicibacterium thermoresistibile]|uniref:Lipid/polyisoprenoid-binding YceI-like domain-containing protein n=2 Tax=Mycolicibacterium thermoresistibile TaxID=1797 RepID=G7CD12_MYCT3|nr:YceI family protein [Mycolicibacterium thermoresistibile]EHI14172.1 hypothetical protein KEK_04302 [Mycolicibacterium thermoresistibile ATCC 19527]MCV7188716.1 YceI family protein [Mycolicibacterium thermoresistibile]GAT16756.1 putative uncharacterized protein [Mycolicibacterium thermoresistibile]SNW18816.1 YceI like family protein [Mycolicibacterium thermoresistibile]